MSTRIFGPLVLVAAAAVMWAAVLFGPANGTQPEPPLGPPLSVSTERDGSSTSASTTTTTTSPTTTAPAAPPVGFTG